MTRRRLPGERRLFEPDEMTFQPSPQVRLRRLASRAPARAARDARWEEDLKAMTQLRRWGSDLASRFGLSYKALDPERDGVVGHYGICYEDGLIRVRLRHAKTGRLLKESSLVDTLCHELAHLRYMDHSVRFQRLYGRILEKARQLGYYRPGPGEARKPRQLDLFEAGVCGTQPTPGLRRSENARPV
jgi:hypothetical protein